MYKLILKFAYICKKVAINSFKDTLLKILFTYTILLLCLHRFYQEAQATKTNCRGNKSTKSKCGQK